MGVGAVLNTAVSGLRITQASIEVVSQNIANADTIGYTRRQLVQSEQNLGDRAGGVISTGVQRLLDVLAQRQLRTEASGAGYTGVAGSYQTALDQLYGSPGGATALDTLFNKFTQSLQTLAGDPSSYTARTQTLDAASTLASTMNDLSGQVQNLRARAEQAIGTAVKRANALLGRIGELNTRIVSSGDAAAPALLDERDKAIDELSTYLDLRVSESATRGVVIATTGGMTLLDGSRPRLLSFDERGSIGANALYSTDPAARGVGAISLQDGSAVAIDLIANGAIRSGQLAGLVEMRDKVLVEAQDQLDALAAQMSRALSDRALPASAVTAGASSGFDLDLSTLPASGDALSFAYKDASGLTRTAKIIRVEDASQLPLPNDGSADRIIGLSFAGAPASLVAPLNAALGPALSFSSSGSTLRVLDDGATTKMLTAEARATNMALTGSGVELPLFYDKARNAVFTGSFDGGSSTRGFAQRIAVNPAVLADRSKLVVYDASTPQGDATRPQFMLDALTVATQTFATTTGLGGRGAPFTGSLADFTQRLIERRGAAAEQAKQLDAGQNVALSAAQSRFEADAKVNIDSEMAQLTQLQNAYAANARVFTAAKEMLDMLFRI